MKNKRLIWTLVFLAILTLGSIGTDLFKKEQQSTHKVAKVGILQFVTHDALDQIEKGIEDGLKEAGYKGDKVQITLLNAEGDQSKIQTMSKQLVNDKNDVVIGIATPAAQGLAAATKDIPVIMGAISDPVGAKLVKDLKHPEGNVTGTSNQVPIKQTVELVKSLTPNAKTIGILYASSEDNSKSQVESFKKYAEQDGLNVVEYAVPSTNEINTTMSVMTGKVDAIWTPQDNTIASSFSTVISLANQAKIPVYTTVDTMVKEGGLASVAQNQYELGKATARSAINVLKGKKVKDIPVDVIDDGTPTLNLKVARDLNITIPDDVLKQSDIAVKADK